MIYLDTSAAAKLVLPEPESDALAVFLVERMTPPLVSSALLYPELVRAVNRHRPDVVDRAVAILQRIMTIPLTHDILAGAVTVGSPQVRTLDALHLASALSVRSELDALVTYDKRLADSATGAGLVVATPG